MPARAIRSLPFRRSGPGSPHVESVGLPTSSHELNSWSVVRCPVGAVRSRWGVASLDPTPSDHVVEDRYRGGLVRSRSPRPSCRGRRSQVDDGVVAPAGLTPRSVVTTVIAGPEPPRPLDAPLAGSRPRHRVGATSFVRRVTVSCSPWLPVPVWRNASARGASLTVEEGDFGAGELCSLERGGPMSLTRWRVLLPSRADVTCSPIST
jgi:hypothetical protein